jgi:hypothetical protein
MTASFDDLNTIASNSGFQGRCLYALQVAAVDVMSESNTTTYHQQRIDYARAVISGSANALQVALAVLTNATIAAEAAVATTPDYAIPDSDIQYAVNTLYNALAGVGS